VSIVVSYWVNAAREQNRWRIDARRAARQERRVRKSGALYDQAIAHRERREIFMAEARRMRDELRRQQEHAA
jgi:hypothetical protein